MELKTAFALEDGLDLRKVITTGSVLQINLDYDDTDYIYEADRSEKTVDIIGSPVPDFKEFEKGLVPVDNEGYVKKKIIEEGGGFPLHEGCTASVAFSGYWEHEPEPFDMKGCKKPLVVNLKENGLLPGLQTAVMSMLVGEMSVFLLSHEVMYGEMGIPPRIQPKAQCVFYIKLIRSIITPEEGDINFSESNMFQRVYREVTMLYGSGITLYKSNNYTAAIQLFKKAEYMLHKCRLADESEEQVQEKMLIRLYTNLAVCYNITKQPLKACTACNELNRLNRLWNNSKALFLNAKALRMIGQFNSAEIRLKKAMKISPNPKDLIKKEFQHELELLEKARETCNKNKLLGMRIANSNKQLLSEEFKQEVDNLIKNFKKSSDLCKLTLPAGLNTTEIAYVKESCIRNNLFFTRIKSDCIQNDEGGSSAQEINEDNFALDKDKEDAASIENDDLSHSRG